jgi:hypothetical protein
VAEAMPPEAASALTAIASPCRKTATATLSGPGTGRNRGGISPCLEPASDSTVAPTTPTPRPAAKAALLSSSEGGAAAATTASRPAAAEGPTTGAGCPAANAATNPIGSGSYGSEPAQRKSSKKFDFFFFESYFFLNLILSATNFIITLYVGAVTLKNVKHCS